MIMMKKKMMMMMMRRKRKNMNMNTCMISVVQVVVWKLWIMMTIISLVGIILPGQVVHGAGAERTPASASSSSSSSNIINPEDKATSCHAAWNHYDQVPVLVQEHQANTTTTVVVASVIQLELEEQSQDHDSTATTTTTTTTATATNGGSGGGSSSRRTVEETQKVIQQILEAKGVNWTPAPNGTLWCSSSSSSSNSTGTSSSSTGSTQQHYNDDHDAATTTTSCTEQEIMISVAAATTTTTGILLCGTVPSEQESCLAWMVDGGQIEGVKQLTILSDHTTGTTNTASTTTRSTATGSASSGRGASRDTFVVHSTHPWQALSSNLTACLEGLDVFYPTSHTDYIASLHLNQDFAPVPKVVVNAASTADVSRAIQCARAASSSSTTTTSSLKVVARGGGHSGMALAVQDGALVVNIERIQRFQALDENALEFRVGAGSRIGKLLYALAAYGRYVPTGFEMGPSVGGQIVGGAVGPLSHSHGMGIDFLLGAEIVDANGRVLQVSETEHADLFWALRGAGHSQFGIVTELHFRSIPLQNVITYELRFDHQSEDASVIFKQLWHITEAFKDSREIFVALVYEQINGDDWWLGIKGTLNPELFGTTDLDEGELLAILNIVHLKPFQLQATVRHLSWLEASALWSGVSQVSELVTRAHECAHKRWISHSGFSAMANETIIDHVWEALQIPTPDIPNGHVNFVLAGHGGAATDIAPSAMAYPHRQPGLSFCFGNFWEREEDAEKVYAWHYNVLPAMEPLRALGGYANHVARVYPEGFEDRPHEHYYGTNSKRLVRIKALHDPNMVFSHPMSIPTGDVCPSDKNNESIVCDSKV